MSIFNKKEMKAAIYTTFNEGFLETGATMIYSFLQNNKWFDGDIFVLCDEGENCPFSDEKFEQLRKVSDKIKKKTVNSSDYSELFKHFPKCDSKHFRASFYKLEMFRKDDYDAKMYIDADVCFCGNVIELFDICNTKLRCYLCRDVVCKDYTSTAITVKTLNDYANLGFMMLNGRVLNDDDFDKVFNFCKEIKQEDFKVKPTFKGLYGEQDCLNEYLSDAVMIPSLVYDCKIRQYTDKTKILHYYGMGGKPWDCADRYLAFDVFYRNYFFTLKILSR